MEPEITSEQSYRERECLHRASGVSGRFYKAASYIKHLQALKGNKASSFAGRVTPFFWADAEGIQVWLCDGCAAELGLKEEV